MNVNLAQAIEALYHTAWDKYPPDLLGGAMVVKVLAIAIERLGGSITITDEEFADGAKLRWSAERKERHEKNERSQQTTFMVEATRVEPVRRKIVEESQRMIFQVGLGFLGPFTRDECLLCGKFRSCLSFSCGLVCELCVNSCREEIQSER